MVSLEGLLGHTMEGQDWRMADRCGALRPAVCSAPDASAFILHVPSGRASAKGRRVDLGNCRPSAPALFCVHREARQLDTRPV
jgi:hypothetical protein